MSSQPAELRKPLLYGAGQSFCRLVTTVAFDLKVYGIRNVPARGGVIIASNHQSNLDPVLIGAQLRRPLSFLAKSELFSNPVFGWLISNLNAFPIRQGDGDVGAVRETIRRLQEGHALNIFPEGTRSGTGEIEPLLSGIALIVRKAGVPVVPAVVDGSFDALPRGAKAFRSATIRVQFGQPTALSHLKGAEVLARLEATLRRMLDELRAKEPALQAAHARRRFHAQP